MPVLVSGVEVSLAWEVAMVAVKGIYEDCGGITGHLKFIHT